MHKTLLISIVGTPNAGKSTLLNKIINKKISIVSPKINTTSIPITGIITIDKVQMIFYDTPGIYDKNKLDNKQTQQYTLSTIYNSDLVLLILDTTKIYSEQQISILYKMQKMHKKIIVVLNKIDKKNNFAKDYLYHLKQYNLINIYTVSALTGQNLEYLLQDIMKQALDKPWLYPSDVYTNLQTRFLSEEITREKIFLLLNKELPYQISIITENWKEDINNNILTINQTILVPKLSYKKIILGKLGQKIKEISTQSRVGIEQLLEKKVNLFLFIKINKYETNKIINFNNIYIL